MVKYIVSLAILCWLGAAHGQQRDRQRVCPARDQPGGRPPPQSDLQGCQARLTLVVGPTATRPLSVQQLPLLFLLL